MHATSAPRLAGHGPRTPRARRSMAARLAAWALGAGTSAAAAAPLPALSLEPGQTSVSGLSSGGYMAVQLHVAWSSVFRRGVAAVAAGPWNCAEGSLAHATGRCLKRDSPIPVPALQAQALKASQEGLLDPLSNLQRSQVVLFSGTRDTAVRQAVTDDLRRFYEAFVPQAQIRYLNQVPAEHGFVTDDYGKPCGTRGLPYVQDCDVDLAGILLETLAGPLAPRHPGPPLGRFVEFNQWHYASEHIGLASRGYLYLPPGCEPKVPDGPTDGQPGEDAPGGPQAGRAAAGAPICRLHVVLHGCGQSVEDIGDTYLRQTGYTRWADTNRIALLFPQTSRKALNSCWDWWGYTGPRHATRQGPQVAAIVAMVQALGGQTPSCRQAWNLEHLWAGRAVVGPWGRLLASGSGAPIGWMWQRTGVAEAPAGHHRPARCA